MKDKMLRLALSALVFGCVMLFAAPVFAAGAGMPWEGVLAKVVASLNGPTVYYLGILILLGAFMMSWGSDGTRMAKNGIAAVVIVGILFNIPGIATALGRGSAGYLI